MPILPIPDYSPPAMLANGHVQSIAPSLIRPVPHVDYVRERMDTKDGDFILLDWSFASGPGGSERLVIVTHGLEGHSRRKYVCGMARALNRAGWDVLARNCRGCGGEMNRLPRFYHSGEIEDLHATVHHALAVGRYRQIALVGFSMGGNQTLRYLGLDPDRVPREICAAVAVSAPCDLADSVRKLESLPAGRIYVEYLLHSLRAKVRAKHAMFPDIFDITGLDAISTFREFDERYTAPLFGFENAEDYWRKASSRPVLRDIRVPTLILNAKDDPFLGPRCYPEDEARENPNLYLETPESGGHVGFILLDPAGEFWSEKRSAAFLNEHTPA
ncbi:hypothetical protein GGQ74_002606 [Desulfobaculum xiamenense]|uniref:AB hydrolase-1 domain-containing protein n=1 Tax=Desulfobaculum xiamenense TaxID=995050 RepID=A0A846QR01_9BACT|nr:alpha/beta fold hydrolase [Desulfobaculum xiamenense]NJB68912.1 hypothetical protein [Desulfobaculum xiamenense]